MNKLKKNITLFLTVFIFAITCAFTFSIEKSYATSNKNEISNVEYQVAKGSSSHSSHSSSRSSSSFKPSSSSFKSSSSTSKPSSSSSKPSSSYTKPKSSTTKPDSGSFSTKPKPEATINEGTTGNNSNNTTKPKSSTTKPDSGSFSTKPNTNSKSNQNDTSNSKNKKNDDYDDYGGSSSRRTYIPPAYGRGFFGFGGYNPFRYMGYRMGISPMIMDIVMIITALIVLYVIIDFIRSRKNR